MRSASERTDLDRDGAIASAVRQVLDAQADGTVAIGHRERSIVAWRIVGELSCGGLVEGFPDGWQIVMADAMSRSLATHRGPNRAESSISAAVDALTAFAAGTQGQKRAVVDATG